jgi:hypothetical protein
VSSRASKRGLKYKQKQAALIRKWAIRAAWTLGAMAVVMGLVLAVLSVLPRVSVSVAEPLEWTDPISAPFTVHNAGLVSLRQVGAVVEIDEINPRILVPRGNIPAEWTGNTLGIGDKFTILPSQVFHFLRPEDAKVAVTVMYRGPVLSWERRKTFHFATHHKADGKLDWAPVAEK